MKKLPGGEPGARAGGKVCCEGLLADFHTASGWQVHRQCCHQPAGGTLPGTQVPKGYYPWAVD